MVFRMRKMLLIFKVLSCCIVALSSCKNDPFDEEAGSKVKAVLTISSGMITTRGPLVLPDVPPADGTLDNEVITLRILAFERTGSKDCLSNEVYDIADQTKPIRHEIDADTYDFVFIANEPSTYTSQLNAIADYSALGLITFPASAINSEDHIPMVQEIKHVEVVSGGYAIVTGDPLYGPGQHDPLQLHLSRLATRVDVILESTEDLDAVFKGVTFSGIPVEVPLLSGDNTSAARTETRSFTVSADSGYFTPETPSTPGNWAMRMTRFILPFSNFPASKSDDTKAVTFTVNVAELYNPSCKLMIEKASEGLSDNYTLPQDVALLLKGNIATPLTLNIQVLPWVKEADDWQMTDRFLNISEVDVKITDFNGARITFSSNMPRVYVEPTVQMTQTAPTTLTDVTRDTETIFNDLVLKTGDTPIVSGQKTTYRTTRFSYTYDSSTGIGTGYMDILLDEYNIGKDKEWSFSTYETTGQQADFKLLLTGEDKYGGKIRREIKVNTRQYGIRFQGENYGVEYTYMGAFFRGSEKGERIISMQIARNSSEGAGTLGYWTAQVWPGDEGKIILSSSPSFDPAVGTATPGDPERFPVEVNPFREYNFNAPSYSTGHPIFSLTYTGQENGRMVWGRGRMYFRVGWIGPDIAANAQPEYARIRISFTQAGYEGSGNPWRPTYVMFIRKGEAPDYIMTPTTAINDGYLKGQSRSYARKFSPYNLTHASLSNTTNYVQVTTGTGSFVNYPTQGGAHFQWGLPLGASNVYTSATAYAAQAAAYLNNYRRRAYHPTRPSTWWELPTGYWMVASPNAYTPVWASAVVGTLPADNNVRPAGGHAYTANYGGTYELCPSGYHRPSDGYTDQISYNGIYPNVSLAPAGTTYVNPVTLATVALRYDGSVGITQSEWRQSLWRNPWVGESSPSPGDPTYITYNLRAPDGRSVIRERTSPLYKREGGVNISTNTPFGNPTDNTSIDQNLFLQYGTYADGFFDRRPIKVISLLAGNMLKFGVALDTPQAAFPGVVIYNPENMASIFFPAAGRRLNTWEGANLPGTYGGNNAGYYWSSSVAPATPRAGVLHNDTAWGVTLSHTDPGHIHEIKDWGYSIRCVQNP